MVTFLQSPSPPEIAGTSLFCLLKIKDDDDNDDASDDDNDNDITGEKDGVSSL